MDAFFFFFIFIETSLLQQLCAEAVLQISLFKRDIVVL